MTVFTTGNAPAPLIYPPQYKAVVIALSAYHQYYLGEFYNNFVSTDGTLQLNGMAAQGTFLPNGQIFSGALVGKQRLSNTPPLQEAFRPRQLRIVSLYFVIRKPRSKDIALNRKTVRKGISLLQNRFPILLSLFPASVPFLNPLSCVRHFLCALSEICRRPHPNTLIIVSSTMTAIRYDTTHVKI